MFLSNRGSFRPETSGAYTLRRRGRRRPKSGSAIGACAVARLAGSGGPIGDYYGSANKTLAFDDISYQSAREESQQAIFSGWCQLFDYFGAESCVQLSVVNRPIPADLIGRKRFFDAGDPATAAYAEEYNRILNDKMR